MYVEGCYFSSSAPLQRRNCELLKTFIAEDYFAETISINLKHADTIHVIDRNGLFGSCTGLRVHDRPVVVMHDSLFKPRIKLTEEEMKYYAYYFLIYDITILRDTAKIAFFKMTSNHEGVFEYKAKGANWERVGMDIVRY